MSADTIAEGSISFPEFGKPTSGSLLTKAKEISQRISGPETHAVATKEGTLTARVFTPIEFQSTKGEDRIFSGFVDTIPLMILADEASNVITASGQVISGGGGIVAQEAILGTLEVLSGQLKEGLNSSVLYKLLRDSYELATERIKKTNLPGRTTLITSFLYNQDGLPVWYYAAVGNGRLSLGSPSRKPIGYTTGSNLLTSNYLGETPTVGAVGPSFVPEIGTRLYAPNDFLTGATDGIDGPLTTIFNKQKVFLPRLVENANPADSGFSQRLALTLREQRFSDDAVLGTIITNLRK